MPTHQHHAVESHDQAYQGTVSPERENRAAHGNITRVEVCSCGAERRMNINGRHVESSGWVAAED